MKRCLVNQFFHVPNILDRIFKYYTTRLIRQLENMEETF